MLRAVPSIMRRAWSGSVAFKSAPFNCTILSSWALVTLPTFSLLGTPEPLAMPTACFNRAAAGGLLHYEVEAAIAVHIHDHRNGHAAGFAGSFVELLHELTQVDAEFTQRSAHRRGRGGLAAGHLKFRGSYELLCHDRFIRVRFASVLIRLAWAGRKC